MGDRADAPRPRRADLVAVTDPWQTLCWAAAVAADLGTDIDPPIQADGESPWQDTTRLARRHEVVTLAAVGLRAISDGPAAARLDAARTRSMTRSLAQAADTREVLLALSGMDVQCVVLKGLPLSVQAFGAPHVRDAGDVDVLVRSADRDAAEHALVELGYVRAVHPDVPDTGFPRPHDPVQSGFAYRHPERPTVVDMQWRLAATDRLAGVTADRAIAGSVPIDVAGVEARTLSPDEHYLFVVAHGAKHRFARLKWLVDVAALRRHVDLRRVRSEAERRGHAPMHDLAGSLIDEVLLGRPSPPTRPGATAMAALTAGERMATARVLDRERYLLGLYRGVRPWAHQVAWRARRGFHSLRWSSR